jgi:hypothetical protein
MKKLLILLLLVIGCSEQGSNQSNRVIRYDGYSEFTQYNVLRNKVISYVDYCDSCGDSGDLITFHFQDGTKFQIYAYKYNMKVNF